MAQQSKTEPARIGPIRRDGWIKENLHYFTFGNVCFTVSIGLLGYFKIQPNGLPKLNPDQILMLKGAWNLAALLLLIFFFAKVTRFIQKRNSGPAALALTNAAEPSASDEEPQKAPRSLVVLEDWKRADSIIGLAKNSLVIIDSFFHNQTGDLPGWADHAIKNRTGAKLNVSIYMASPDHIFGAQRLREWDCGGPNDAPESEKITRLKNRLEIHISEEECRSYKQFICENVTTIRRNVANRPVSLKLFTYPTMVASRFFVIDETDLIFGWFPLLDSNPYYSCCHLKLQGLAGTEADLAKRLLRQVDIIKGISKPWEG